MWVWLSPDNNNLICDSEYPALLFMASIDDMLLKKFQVNEMNFLSKLMQWIATVVHLITWYKTKGDFEKFVTVRYTITNGNWKQIKLLNI